jgi:hypothetical protein
MPLKDCRNYPATIWCVMLKQFEMLNKADNAPKKGENVQLVLKKEAQETPRINVQRVVRL